MVNPYEVLEGDTHGEVRSMRSSDQPNERGNRASLAFVAVFLLGYVAILFGASVPKAMVPPEFADLTWGTLASLGIVALTRLVTRGDRSQSPARSMGASARQFLAGATLGFAVYALVIAAISIGVGPLRVSPTAAPTPVASVITIVGFFALSCMEELGFRGYPLRTLVSVFDERIGVLVVSILFAASHILFGWPWQAVLLGVLPSGLLFGVAAVVSGGLAMPVGVHMALNVAQWIAGEKERPGFFTVVLDPDRAAQGAAVAPIVGATVPLLIAMALWRWYPRSSHSQRSDA